MLRKWCLLALFIALGCGDKPATAPPPDVAPTDAPPETRAQIAAREGLKLKQFDLNRDGEPDVFKYFRELEDAQGSGEKLTVVVRKEIDINHDGKVDIIRIYGDAGAVVEEQADLDFDGEIDERAFFKAGVVARKEIDLNYDGEPDVIRYYQSGKIQRIESDRDTDGRVDTWEYFEKGELDRIGTDRDGDGKVDHWETRGTDSTEVSEDTSATKETESQPNGEEAPEESTP